MMKDPDNLTAVSPAPSVMLSAVGIQTLQASFLVGIMRTARS